MKIKYQFATGNSEIAVSEEWADILIDLDRQEYNNNQKERRRHTSLDAMDYEGEIFADDTDILADLITSIDNESLYNAISLLKPKQQEVIKDIFFKGMSITEYAILKNVEKSAICHRLQTVYKNIKKYL